MDSGEPHRARTALPTPLGRGKGWRAWMGRAIAIVLFLLVPAPIYSLLVFRFFPVPFTPQMAVSLLSGQDVHYRWRAAGEMSSRLGNAVIGSEDQNFCRHHGFDWREIGHAITSHERHPRRRLRGASTISQQAARSLFLVPARSWVRKGLEAYLTVLMEFLWPKQRILTVYLNLVDWGHGNFGAEAAAQSYFHKSAASLTGREAARLAAVLPDPDEWHADQPGPYVARRTGVLAGRASEVTRDGLDACVRH